MTMANARVPSGWVRAKVCALGEVVAGKAKNIKSDAPMHPYLRVANVFDGRIDTSDVLEMPFSIEEFRRYELRIGDVLLNEGQSLALVGRCSIYRGEYPGPCAIQNALLRFRAYEDADASFAEQLFRWCQLSGVFARISTQTTSIAHLGVKRLSNLEVLSPPLPEQRKIAAILSSVDEVIATTEAVIEQLQVVKKAMMQELLTRGLPGRHTRFKQTEIGEIPEEWEVIALSRLAHRITKGTTPTSYGYEYITTGVPFLRVENIDHDGKLNLEGTKFISQEAHDSLSRSKLAPGDLLFSIAGALGRVALVPDDLRAANINQAISRICLDEDGDFSSVFVLHALMGSQVEKQVSFARAALAQANLNLKQVGQLMIPLPTKSEQLEISEALDDIRDRISTERKVLRAQHLTKAALMSVLLTGEVRVTPDEDAA